MGRLLKFIAATAIVILAVSARRVRGFDCFCNSYYDTACIGETNTITCPSDREACEVSSQAGGTYTYQGCVGHFLSVFSCEEELVENPGSSVPYRYCCKEELCNSEQALQALIAAAGGEASSASVTSSSNTSSANHYEATSASSLNPTGTSQPVTMPKVGESTSVATRLPSRGESSTQYEAVASDVNGIQNTSPLIIPTSTPSFATNPTTAVTSEVSTPGSNTLSCICNIGFMRSCLGDPFCSVSGDFAHCILEVDKSDMAVLLQGCSDVVTTYLTCSGKVVENNAGRLVLCCTTDNCNSLEALVDQLDSSDGQVSTSSTTVPPHPSTVRVEFPAATSSIPTAVGDTFTAPPAYAIALITVLAFILLVFIIIIVVVSMLHFFPRHVVGIAIPTESDGTPTISTESVDFSNDHLQDMIGTTSGSGSGMPLLIQRSIATQVTLEHLIGKGKFGEVWKGSYKGDDIAVKIFHTREEASFFHEVDIYSTCLIRHPNIVRFVAADNKDIGMATQLWLITEYCSNGSLYELLLVEALDEATMLKLLHTAVSGLAHLHQEITGTEGKQAIAHRDIKSRNILVKADYTCCIADLGLAIRYNKTTDTVEEPPTKRVGTRRYLSPEILNDTINVHNFDCFKRSDMYSFGLVMWETARRGECAGHVEDYQLPYFDLVPSDPSFEDMKKVVVDDLRRPGIPNRWHQSELFHGLAKIIEQCWHHNGEARVTALRVKKNLHNLHSMLGKNKMSSMTKLNHTSLSKIVTPASK